MPSSARVRKRLEQFLRCRFHVLVIHNQREVAEVYVSMDWRKHDSDFRSLCAYVHNICFRDVSGLFLNANGSPDVYCIPEDSRVSTLGITDVYSGMSIRSH